MITNIVMLTKDRWELTIQSLTTLYRNTNEADFNITIIDDGSNEISQAALHGFLDAKKSNVAMLRIENSQGVTGRARNLGVYWSEKTFGRGEYLYLSDNDVYFLPKWLNELTSFFYFFPESNFRLVGGWNHPFLNPHTEVRGCGVYSHDAIAGASQLMRWETWDKYGPLVANAPGTCQGEDWLFCQKIIEDGGKVGSIYPRVVLNCGITNSEGKPAQGPDVMLAELQEARKTYTDIYWE